MAGEVDGVDWLMEKREDGAHLFTTANREVYVEFAHERAELSVQQDDHGLLSCEALVRNVPPPVLHQGMRISGSDSRNQMTSGRTKTRTRPASIFAQVAVFPRSSSGGASKRLLTVFLPRCSRFPQRGAIEQCST